MNAYYSVLSFSYLNLLNNLQGILYALVLSIIPLMRTYHWQSFLMPVIALSYVYTSINHDLNF